MTRGTLYLTSNERPKHRLTLVAGLFAVDVHVAGVLLTLSHSRPSNAAGVGVSTHRTWVIREHCGEQKNNAYWSTIVTAVRPVLSKC